MRGAIVLAGGRSERMRRRKPLIDLNGRPMLAWVLDAAEAACDEVVVASRGSLADEIRRAFPGFHIVRDGIRTQTPLAGLRAGAQGVESSYVAALSCDIPLLRPRVLEDLFDRARGADAAIPRWPDGQVEPLLAVYRRAALRAAVRDTMAAGERSNLEMIRRLSRPRFVPVSTLRRRDRDLRSFLNVNAAGDLARVLRLMRRADRP